MPNENGVKAAAPADYSVQSQVSGEGYAPFAPGIGSGAGALFINIGQVADEVLPWNPLYPNLRDRQLTFFSQSEPMVASAVYSMMTRAQSLNYTLSGPPRAKKFAQTLLDAPMGVQSSLAREVGKLVHDFYTADNGAFIELWRPGNPAKDAGSRPVLGFSHLDSRLCWRSFDPEFPVWYTNPITGEIHKLHRSRVLMASDNPQGIELARNIGFCATSRVLRMSRLMRNILIYRDEKVSGRFTRAIGAIKGLSAKQIKDALRANRIDSDDRGYVIYQDIPFLISPNTESGADIDIILKDLASIPDGFNFSDDTTLYAYILAFCFGVDAREFWPATTSGATKADASVQNMKARGRGLGVLIETLEWLLRQCLPETVTFEYDFTDDEQDKQTAEIHQTEVNTLKVLYDMGAVSGQEARMLAVSKGVIDEELLSTLEQPVTSDDNPDAPQDTGTDTTPDISTLPPDEMKMGIRDTSVREASPPSFQAVKKKSFDDYRRSLRALTRGYWLGEFGRFDFVDGMVSAIQRHFEQAWQEVEKQYGITRDERTEASQDRLTLAINTEIGFIPGFADAIAENSKDNGGALQPLLDRAELWANGYDRTFILAQTIVGSDIKLKWVFGATIEHCDDCSQYVGKVFYRSQWEAAGVRPRGDMLQCSGLNCLCEFEPTTDRKTPGEVPPLIGHKEHTVAIPS
jgi:hypothetical protein